MEWISNKVQKPKRYGLYLVSNGYSWFIKLINQGVILQYDDLDDGYSCDPMWEDIEWWWQELPNRPDGESPYYD
jgi:hypothetical protein